MRKFLLPLALTATIAPATAPVLAADPHPFTVHDLLAMQRISDPQPSPRGDRVAFVVRVTDLDANRGRTDLWMVNVDGGGLTRLTSDPAADDNPRWAPDGQSLYFLSSRSGSSQVWRLPVAAGGGPGTAGGGGGGGGGAGAAPPPATRRRQPHRLARRRAARFQPGGLPRLPDPRLHP